MDGLKDVIPMTETYAKIMDWETNEFIEFRSMKPQEPEKHKKKTRSKKNDKG